MLNELKHCKDCSEDLPLESFYNDKRSATGKSFYCKPCHSARRNKWRQNGGNALESKREAIRRKENPDRYRDYWYRSQYKITLADYNRMLLEQGGACAVCGEKEEKLVVDHSHESGEVRELLCDGCNTSLGLLKEDLRRVEKLAEYIKKHG